MAKKSKIKTPQRFWARVDIKTDDECWEWTGPKDKKTGYGCTRDMYYKSNTTTVQRVAWSVLFGDIPDGMQIGHKCRNRLCVNPAHLYVTTHAENMREAAYREKYLYPNAVSAEALTKALLRARADKCRHELSNVDYTNINDTSVVDIYNIVSKNKMDNVNQKKIKSDTMICGHWDKYIISSHEGTSYCLMCEYNSQEEVLRKLRVLYDDIKDVLM